VTDCDVPSCRDFSVANSGPSHLMYFAGGMSQLSYLLYCSEWQKHDLVELLSSAACAVVECQAETGYSVVGVDSQWVGMRLMQFYMGRRRWSRLWM